MKPIKPASHTAPTRDVRVIREGSISKERRAALRWLTVKTPASEDPIILTYRQDKGVLGLRGDAPFSDYIYVEKVPADIEFNRTDSYGKSGVFYMDQGTEVTRIYGPEEDLIKVQQNIFDAVSETLKTEYGVIATRAPWRPNSNDMVFEKDGEFKKFLGFAYFKQSNFVSFTLCIHFDHKKLAGVYKLDNPKFLMKGNITDLSEVVGGLDEANPAIGKELLDKVLIKLGRKMRWELHDSQLTPEEVAGVDKTAEELAAEGDITEWVMTGKL